MHINPTHTSSRFLPQIPLFTCRVRRKQQAELFSPVMSAESNRPVESSRPVDEDLFTSRTARLSAFNSCRMPRRRSSSFRFRALPPTGSELFPPAASELFPQTVVPDIFLRRTLLRQTVVPSVGSELFPPAASELFPQTVVSDIFLRRKQGTFSAEPCFVGRCCPPSDGGALRRTVVPEIFLRLHSRTLKFPAEFSPLPTDACGITAAEPYSVGRWCRR